MLMLLTVPDWRVRAISARCARRDLIVEEETGPWAVRLMTLKLV